MALQYDQFHDAIIGTTCGTGETKLVYDHDKCIEILMERDGMSADDALDFFWYNYCGAYLGEGTPVIVTLKSPEECIDELLQ